MRLGSRARMHAPMHTWTHVHAWAHARRFFFMFVIMWQNRMTPSPTHSLTHIHSLTHSHIHTCELTHIVSLSLLLSLPCAYWGALGSRAGMLVLAMAVASVDALHVSNQDFKFRMFIFKKCLILRTQTQTLTHTHVCTRTYIYTQTCTHADQLLSTCVVSPQIRIYAYIIIRIYVYMYIRIHVHAFLQTCIPACMHGGPVGQVPEIQGCL